MQIEHVVFVLAQVKSEKRGMSNYVYLTVVKYIVGYNITVTGLKSMDTTKQTFKLIKCDVFNINFEKIQALY